MAIGNFVSCYAWVGMSKWITKGRGLSGGLRVKEIMIHILEGWRTKYKVWKESVTPHLITNFSCGNNSKHGSS